MLVVLLLKDFISDAEGLQQNDSLPVEKTSFVFVPVQDVEVLSRSIVPALVFYHALSHYYCALCQSGVQYEDSFRSLVPDLDYTQVFYL